MMGCGLYFIVNGGLLKGNVILMCVLGVCWIKLEMGVFESENIIRWKNFIII